MSESDDVVDVDAAGVDSSAETLPPFASASAPVVPVAQRLAARVFAAVWARSINGAARRAWRIWCESPTANQRATIRLGSALANLAGFSVPSASSSRPGTATRGAGENTSSSTSDDRYATNAYPNEKSLASFLSDGGRFKRADGHKVNKELFCSKLRQSASHVVVDNENWQLYALTNVKRVELTPGKGSTAIEVYDEVTSELRKLRSEVDLFSTKEMDGSNLAWTLRNLPRGLSWDGTLDIGPTMGQIRLYVDPVMDWPPKWQIGKPSFIRGQPVPEAYMSQKFIDFLTHKSVKFYRTLMDEPLEEHDFLPPRFKKGDPFYAITVQFPAWIKFDDYLANAFVQFCECADVGEPELPWLHILKRILKMPQNAHKLSDMFCVSEHYCSTEATIDISDVSGRMMCAMYDPNIVAEHFLDYLLQLQVENEKQYRKLSHPEAKASFTRITEFTVISRFADSLDMYYKVEPPDPYGRGLYRLADAWRNRNIPERLTDVQRKCLDVLKRTDVLMADLRTLSARHGRSGTAPPAKYQLRHVPAIPGSRALLTNAHDGSEEAYMGHGYEQYDYSQYEPGHMGYAHLGYAQPSMGSPHPPNMLLYGGDGRGPPWPPRPPFAPRGPPRGPSFSGPPRGPPFGSLTPRGPHPQFDRGRGRGPSQFGRGRGRSFGPSPRGAPRFVMPDPGYYGLRLRPEARPPRPFGFGRGRGAPRGPHRDSQRPPPRGEHPPIQPTPHTTFRSSPGYEHGEHGRGQGARIARADSTPASAAHSAIDALVAAVPSLPPDAIESLRMAAAASAASSAGETAAVAGDGGGADTSAAATDISAEHQDTYEVPDPNSSVDPYAFGAEEQKEVDMHSHQWDAAQLQYIGDLAHYNEDGTAYYGVPEDYVNSWHTDEHDYLTSEAEALDHIVNMPQFFKEDNQLSCMNAFKAANVDCRTKLVGDSGASRFYFLKRMLHECLCVVHLPFSIPIGTANGVIQSKIFGLRPLYFERTNDSVWVTLVPGLLVPFDETEQTAVELASITVLNSLGFDIQFKNTLFQSQPHTIASAHNDKCIVNMISDLGKLPVLDVMLPENVIGKKLYSFYDDGPYSPARDAHVALKCAELHEDRLAPFLRMMHSSIITELGTESIDKGVKLKQIKVSTFVAQDKHGDSSDSNPPVDRAHVGVGFTDEKVDSSTGSAQPHGSSSRVKGHDGAHDQRRRSSLDVLRVFLICFGLATTACLSVLGMPLRFVGGLEINDTLRAHAARRFPDAVVGADLRKYEKDIRKGKVRPPECDIIEGSVTCQSRCTLRWMQRPSSKYIDSHDLFYVQTRVIGYTMPKYVVLEITPPDNENYTDYECCENMICKLGYNVNVTRRTPSALCGDGTCRFRWILIGVRNDIAHGTIDLREYLADKPAAMCDLLDPARSVPAHLWLDYGGVIPRTTHDAGEKPGINDIVERSTWGASTFAHLIGWHTAYGKGFRIYDINSVAPTITSFGNILIYDNRDDGCCGVRQLTIAEMARLSSFDNETIAFLQSLPEPFALKCIANAVPLGLLSTVYTAVLDHAHATRQAELALVTLRSGKTTEPPIARPPPAVVTAASRVVPITPAPVARIPAPHATIRSPSFRAAGSAVPSLLPLAPGAPAPRTIPNTAAPRLGSKDDSVSKSAVIDAIRRTAHSVSNSIRGAATPATAAPVARPSAAPTNATTATTGNAPVRRPLATPTRIPLGVEPLSHQSPLIDYADSPQVYFPQTAHSTSPQPSSDPPTEGQGVHTHSDEVRPPEQRTGDDTVPAGSDNTTVDSEGNVINPHLTRDGSSRGAPLDINPRFGRYIGEPKSNWPPMEKPGTPSYQRAVDRVLKLHQRTAHASGEMLEHLIENSLNHGCTPGDSRYLPVCNECLLGGYDSTRRTHNSTSTTKLELIRRYLPGEYWMFDVNELPVYSAFGHFRYAYTCVCVVSQYRFVYYASDLGTATYLDFCDCLVKEVKMRLGRSPKVFYCDDFSTFSQQFEVALAYSEFGISPLKTPPEMHWLNGDAENSIRVLTRKTRVNLSQLVGVVINNVTIRDPQPFWPFAMENARQVYNVLPNPVLFRIFGVPLSPLQVYTNNTELKLDLGMFHRFGDLCYIVDYVRDRAGKLAPVSYRGYYMFNPSWSTITKKYCDMSKADVVLSQKDNKLLVTGMAKYPNESLMHPRALAEPSIALNSPNTTVRAHDTATTGTIPVDTVIGRDGTRRSQSNVPSDVPPAPATPAAPSPNRSDRVVDRDSSNGFAQPQSVPWASPTASQVLDRGMEHGSERGTGTHEVAPPSRLPPPAVLRHKDYPISFKPGSSKRGNAGARFDGYRVAKTTREYFNLGGRHADWNWDIAKGIVKFDDASLNELADATFGNRVPRSSAARAREARNRASQSGPVARNAHLRDSSRGRFSAFVAQIANFGFHKRGPHAEYLQQVLGASAAYALRAVSYLPDYSLNVKAMNDAYRTMINHTPDDYVLHAVDMVEDVLDHLLLHVQTVDDVALQMVSSMDVVLDEQNIASLKEYDPEMRNRMARAIYKEVADLIKIGTFELVPLPDGRQAIGSKLVLKVKYRADGSWDKDKARLVALGFLERVGIDFYSTFAPMASLTSVRTIMSIAVHYGLPIFHADVPQAFLRSEMDTEVFLRLPKGVNIVDVNDASKSTSNGLVLRLWKSLYGLKQSPQLWNQELDKFFNKIGFKRADAEACLYYRYDPTSGKFALVLSEVDDLVVSGNDSEYIAHFRNCLIKSFASKDDDGKPDKASIAWEPIESFLGIKIKYDVEKGILTMNIKNKIDNLFDDHHSALHKIGTANLPLPSSFNDNDFPEEGDWSHLETYLRKHYASLVGSIIYLHTTCRPDISYAIGVLARGMHKPTRVHVNKLKCLLKYLNSHRDTPLVYKRRDTCAHKHYANMSAEDPTLFAIISSNENGDNGFDILTGFSDADFAKSFAEKRRSTSGYAFFVFGNLITWKSKLQPLTAGSTHEAELIALSYAADEGVWIRRLLKEIKFAVYSAKPHFYTTIKQGTATQPPRDVEKYIDSLPPSPIMVDNKGTTQTVNNPMSTAQASKHLDLRYFKVRDHIRERKLRVQFLRTHLNVADFFTKALPDPAFRNFRETLMGFHSGR